jgi:hypothetical protein
MIAWCTVASVLAHSGPPFPIVENRVAGSYEVSVWTDPDTSDDGSAGGQFWITLRVASGAALPADTKVDVAVTPLDRTGSPNSATAEPVAGEPSKRFAAVVMDHEGRFRVRVTLSGTLGQADVEADVDATYDLRPSPLTIAFVLVPFVLVGLLWLKALRSGPRRAPPAST